MSAYQNHDYFPIFLAGLVSGSVTTITILISIKVSPEQMQDVGMSYTDFITVMLTSVTVVITILAIFIAILALWGYSQFQKMTETASKSHLEKLLLDSPFGLKIEAVIIQHVSEQLQNGELRKVLVDRIDSILLNDASLRDERVQQANDKPFTD